MTTHKMAYNKGNLTHKTPTSYPAFPTDQNIKNPYQTNHRTSTDISTLKQKRNFAILPFISSVKNLTSDDCGPLLCSASSDDCERLAVGSLYIWPCISRKYWKFSDAISSLWNAKWLLLFSTRIFSNYTTIAHTCNPIIIISLPKFVNRFIKTRLLRKSYWKCTK